MGPAFGGIPIDHAALESLVEKDMELIRHICNGDHAGFLESIRTDGDKNNVCGVPPIYLALRLLGQVNGTPAGYAVCLRIRT